MKNMTTLILSILVILSYSNAQESLRNQLFTEVDQVLEKAKQEMADILSPKNFKQSMDYYNKAQKSLKEGGNIQDIRKNINGAKAHLVKALDFADLAKLSFPSPIEARRAAQNAGADAYANELWKKAEDQFRDAMEEMEDNDLEDAKDEAAEAETKFRNAELKAIKVDLVGPAKESLKQAEDIDADDYAPISLNKAKQSISEVEKLLEENRYAQEEGLSLAQNAKYHALHTVFLTKTIKNLEGKDNAFEEILLQNENNLKRLADQLDITLDFTEGYNKPIESITAKINSLQESNSKFSRELSSLRDQNTMMEERLSKYTDTEKELQQMIALKKSQEKKVRDINNSFTKDEGQVFLDGDNVILRLYGLTFPTGKSEIRPEYFALLKKVQDGIKEFENCDVIIEGHTDSRGGAELNQTLSNARASAVQAYIMSNMSLPAARIQAVGFGESKPVANNETEAGRAKNRRIDVVIIPEWAQK